METIRKKICLDEFLSHRPGLMPYIKKDDEDQGIQYIDTITSESNYGGFPCDFALISRVKRIDENTGLSVVDEEELSRFRYLDIINGYSEYLDKIENGVILRKIYYSEENLLHLDCSNLENTVTSKTQSVKWVRSKTNNVSFFDCLPVDASFLVSSDSETYFFNQNINDLKTQLLEKLGTDITLNNQASGITNDGNGGIALKAAAPQNIDEIEDVEEPQPSNDTPDETITLTEDEMKLLNKIVYFGDGLTDGVLKDYDYIILLNNYDTLDWYEKYWENWWTNNFQLCTYSGLTDTWEKLILDSNYTRPAFFKFIYDVEKYILGRIRVPEVNGNEVIDGIKVPNYVYYLNYNDYLSWFEDHANLVENNSEVRKKWNDLGGDAFYHLLMGIRPYFLNDLALPDATVTAFTFVPENIEIPLAFIDEAKTNLLYKPYELSVDGDNNVYDGTFDFVGHGENEIGSALTPVFKTFKEKEIFAQSKLSFLLSKDTYYLTDDIYGLFELFEGDNGFDRTIGCLFSCTNKTGNASVTRKEKYFSGVTYEYGKRNGQWEVIKTNIIPETFDSLVREEVLPKLTHNVYQVVGIEKVSTSVTTGNTAQTTTTVTLPDGSVRTSSIILYYEKEIQNQYSWWECQKVPKNSISSHHCGDGEDLDWGNVADYRNILILACVPSASESRIGTYYYMAAYDNGYTNIKKNHTIDSKENPKVFKIPYALNKPMNISRFEGEFSGTVIYDVLSNKNVTQESGNTYVTLKYILGATSGEPKSHSGIHYKEVHSFKPYCVDKLIIDGVYEAEVLYEKIEKKDPEQVYSEELMETRDADLAEITGMEIGTQWTSASCVNAYLYTEDDTDCLQEYPQININVSFNRGNAAAWEKRFKLSECNTMEDLENYGNNYFNI